MVRLYLNKSAHEHCGSLFYASRNQKNERERGELFSELRTNLNSFKGEEVRISKNALLLINAQTHTISTRVAQ